MMGIADEETYYFVRQFFLSLERYRHQMIVLLTGGNFPFSSCLDFPWILPIMNIAVPNFTCFLKKYSQLKCSLSMEI